MKAAPFRIAVLLSGRGSNLQALIDAQHAGVLPIEIVLVASNKPNAQGLRHAEAAGIPTLALDPASYTDRSSYDAALFAHIDAVAPQLIVLAGFMHVLEAKIIAPWCGKMINIHPSLLPKYPGLKTHSRALAAGDVIHGASVHFVNAVLDRGPVISQIELPVLPQDTPETLTLRLLPLEHRLLIATIVLIAAGRVTMETHGVALDGHLLKAPLKLAAGNMWIMS